MTKRYEDFKAKVLEDPEVREEYGSLKVIDQLKAENEALKAQVAALVAKRKLAGELQLKTIETGSIFQCDECGFTDYSVDDGFVCPETHPPCGFRKASYEDLYVYLISETLETLSQTTQAYTKRVQDEAVQAERERVNDGVSKALKFLHPISPDLPNKNIAVWLDEISEIINPQQPKEQEASE